jgi:dTDP-4-amino-4,6-dideoxygalactose transaminase
MRNPAILGGQPLFNPAVNFVKPLLPSYNELEANIKDIFETGMLTKGKYLRSYEENIKEYLGVKHAIGVSSCTMGLIILLKCLDLKGEVIVPSFTFPATVHAIMWNNLKPVFVDCDTETFNLMPSAVEKAITPETSAILGVHIFGNPPDITSLEHMAHKYNLKLIFDSAHGFGTKYKGNFCGSYGHGEVFSTSPTKLMVTGEGGVVTTSDGDLAKKIRTGIEYGNPGDYDCIFPGLNARLGEFNAITGIHSLALLEKNAVKRNELAICYKKHLSSVPGISFQKIERENRSSYKDFAILVGNEFGLSRDLLWKSLECDGISTKRYFYPPNHSQKALEHMKNSCNLPNTDFVADRVLCLPIYYSMTEEIIIKITDTIKNIYENREAIERSEK